MSDDLRSAREHFESTDDPIPLVDKIAELAEFEPDPAKIVSEDCELAEIIVYTNRLGTESGASTEIETDSTQQRTRRISVSYSVAATVVAIATSLLLAIFNPWSGPKHRSPDLTVSIVASRTMSGAPPKTSVSNDEVAVIPLGDSYSISVTSKIRGYLTVIRLRNGNTNVLPDPAEPPLHVGTGKVAEIKYLVSEKHAATFITVFSRDPAHREMIRAALAKDTRLNVAEVKLVVEQMLQNTPDIEIKVINVVHRQEQTSDDTASAPPTDSEAMELVNGQAEQHYFDGEYQKAEQKWRAYLNMQLNASNDKVEDGIAVAKSNVAAALIAQGKFAEAVVFLSSALDIQKRIVAATSSPHIEFEMSSTLTNLGDAHTTIGNYRLAIQYLEQAIEIRERYRTGLQFAKIDVAAQLANSFTNLGVAYQERAEDDKAIVYFEKAVEIDRVTLERTPSQRNRQYLALSLHNLAISRFRLGQLGDAINTLEEALRIWTNDGKIKEIPHPRLAKWYKNLARIYLNVGDLDAAGKYSGEANRMYEELIPDQARRRMNPDVAEAIATQAYVELSEEQFRDAISKFKTAALMRRNIAWKQFLTSTESSALNFSTARRQPQHLLITEWIKHKRDADALYEVVWPNRGLFRKALTDRHKRMFQLTEPSTALASLVVVERSLAQLTDRLLNMPGTAETSAVKREQMNALVAERDRFVRQILASLPSSPPGGAKQPLKSHYELIQRLPERSVFIDFIRFHKVTRSVNGRNLTKPAYAVFLLSRDAPTELVVIDDASAIEVLTEKWGTELQELSGESTARQLSAMLWLPIQEALPSDTKTILICPDTKLAQLPWAALPSPENEAKYLLENYVISIVPDGHLLLDNILAPLVENEGSHGRTLAVVDIDYSDFGGRPSMLNNLPPVLPKIREVFGQQLESLYGKNATYDQVMRQLSKYQNVVFWGHGFFFEKSSMGKAPVTLTPLSDTERIDPLDQHPQLSSGLYLAADSTADRGYEPVSCLSFSRLNLGNTKNVYLMGCETARGGQTTGEGLAGLQRAFHSAGVQSTVASLWRVEPDFTLEMFEHVLAHQKTGHGLHAAVRNAQTHFIRNGKGDSTHPRFWAAWIVSGVPLTDQFPSRSTN